MRSIGISRHKVGAQQRHNLAIGHLLIIVRINLVQQMFQLRFVFQHTHACYQVSKLLLVQHTVLVAVVVFETDIELVQKSLVLLQLKV